MGGFEAFFKGFSVFYKLKATKKHSDFRLVASHCISVIFLLFYSYYVLFENLLKFIRNIKENFKFLFI